MFLWGEIFRRPYQQHWKYIYIFAWAACCTLIYSNDCSDVTLISEGGDGYCSSNSRRLDDSQISSGYWSMDNSLTLSTSNTTVTNTRNEQGVLFNYVCTCILLIYTRNNTWCVDLVLLAFANILETYSTFTSMTPYHQNCPPHPALAKTSFASEVFVLTFCVYRQLKVYLELAG